MDRRGGLCPKTGHSNARGRIAVWEEKICPPYRASAPNDNFIASNTFPPPLTLVDFDSSNRLLLSLFIWRSTHNQLAVVPLPQPSAASPTPVYHSTRHLDRTTLASATFPLSIKNHHPIKPTRPILCTDGRKPLASVLS